MARRHVLLTLLTFCAGALLQLSEARAGDPAAGLDQQALRAFDKMQKRGASKIDRGYLRTLWQEFPAFVRPATVQSTAGATTARYRDTYNSSTGPIVREAVRTVSTVPSGTIGVYSKTVTDSTFTKLNESARREKQLSARTGPSKTEISVVERASGITKGQAWRRVDWHRVTAKPVAPRLAVVTSESGYRGTSPDRTYASSGRTKKLVGRVFGRQFAVPLARPQRTSSSTPNLSR